MYYKVFLIVCTVLCFSFSSVLSQNTNAGTVQEVTGRVLSSKTHQPVAGANILVEGTSRGAATNEEGYFSIKMALHEALIIRCISFRQETIAYDGQTMLIIYLEPKTEELQELVVVGYGKQQKTEIIGSVSSVEGGQLNMSSAISFDNALAGRTAGVLVNTSSGVPGAATSVTIRGISSLAGGSNNPLIVIDGVPVYGTGKDLNTTDYSQSVVPAIGFGGTNVAVGYDAPPEFERNPLANLNPEDIESIEILKDAYATSIYGSRGAAGVILITTKKGSRTGDLQVDIGYSMGIIEPVGTPDVLNGNQYSNIYENYYDGQGYVFPADQNTDWIEEVVRRAVVKNMNLSVSGGDDKLRYYLSSSYLDQPAYIISQDFSRYSGRINLQYYATEIVKFGSQVSISLTDNRALNAQSIYRQAVLRPPTIPVRRDNGEYEYGLSGNSIGKRYINPVALADNQNRVEDRRTIANAYLQIDPAEWVSLKSEFGIDFYNSRAFTRRKGIPGSFIPEGEAIKTLNLNKKYVLSNTANYQFTVGENHYINGVLGQSYETSVEDITAISATGFPNDDINSIGAANNDNINIRQANEVRWALVSYFGRINYEYKHKYLAGVSYRIDGSSRFGRNNRYTGFPAFALGWRISNEPFMDKVNFVDNLKLRASIGFSGINSNAQSYYGTLGQYSISTGEYGSLGKLELVQPPNPNLHWQRKRTFDAGLDFALFHSSLSGTIDYYYSKTTNMLYNTLIPTYFGFATQQINIGAMQNKGIELSLRYFKSWGEFQWSSHFNIAANDNKILELNFQNESYIYSDQGEQVFIEGQSATTLYLFDWAGIDPATGNPLWRYQDGSVNSVPPPSLYALGNEDIHRRSFGEARPDFFGGFTNTFFYKGFEISAHITFSYGGKMFNGTKATLLTYTTLDAHNLSTDILDYWRIQGQQTDTPKLHNPSIVPGGFGARDYTASRNTDRFLEDGSYVRLKTLTLAYSIPAEILTGIGNIRRIRLYVKGTNLFTLTPYSGIDPEVSAFGSNALLTGRDELTMPQNRMIEAGVNIGF